MTTQEARRIEIQPPADVAATAEGTHLSLEMPGTLPGSISVTVDDDVLTVRAERRESPENFKVLRRESRGGGYARSFRLSKDLAREGLSADYRLGVLHVFVPRAEHTIPRKIDVKVET